MLANGTLVLASTDSNADLFWALRGGGGGSFGIVTEYTFKAIDDMPRIIVRIVDRGDTLPFKLDYVFCVASPTDTL